MVQRLEGKVALITGASGGIGTATALEFAREGARGIGIQYATSRERAEAVVDEVRGLGVEAMALRADVTNRQQAFGLVEKLVESFGGLDILVCFAGHPFRRDEWFKPFEELTEEDLMGPLRVDLLGSVYCVQAAAPRLKESGNGRVVLVSSTPALTGDLVGISYLMAKGALVSLTKALAIYFGPHNVHVNCLVLGSVATEAMKGLTAEEERELREETSLKRIGTPEEVARKALFLASEDSDFQTGTNVVVDGGLAFR